jgi:hypothetical protein
MNNQQNIQISINQETFERLLNQKAISIEELSCLNRSSKQVIHQCLLKSLLARSKR